jgi:hypothetical protein
MWVLVICLPVIPTKAADADVLGQENAENLWILNEQLLFGSNHHEYTCHDVHWMYVHGWFSIDFQTLATRLDGLTSPNVHDSFSIGRLTQRPHEQSTPLCLLSMIFKVLPVEAL